MVFGRKERRRKELLCSLHKKIDSYIEKRREYDGAVARFWGSVFGYAMRGEPDVEEIEERGFFGGVSMSSVDSAARDVVEYSNRLRGL